jgi:hypothetical protein
MTRPRWRAGKRGIAPVGAKKVGLLTRQVVLTGLGQPTKMRGGCREIGDFPHFSAFCCRVLCLHHAQHAADRESCLLTLRLLRRQSKQALLFVLAPISSTQKAGEGAVPRTQLACRGWWHRSHSESLRLSPPLRHLAQLLRGKRGVLTISIGDKQQRAGLGCSLWCTNPHAAQPLGWRSQKAREPTRRQHRTNGKRG